MTFWAIETTLLLLAAPAPASAPAATNERAELARAFSLYKQVEFGRSIEALDELFRTTKDEWVKSHAKLYLGMNYAAIGNPGEAKHAFVALLEINPDFVLPEFVSPTISNLFDEVKRHFRVIPRLSHSLPTAIDAATKTVLQIRAERMRPGYALVLRFRIPPAKEYSAIDAIPVAPTLYEVSLPAALLVRDVGYTFVYYIEAKEASGAPLMTLREADNPFSVPVSVPLPVAAQPAPKPVYKQTWFWLTIGGGLALAAGATTAAVVATRPQPLGQVNVSITYPEPVR